MTNNVIEFPWERTAEGRAHQAAQKVFGIIDYVNEETFLIDWGMIGYWHAENDFVFELEDHTDGATVEYLNKPDSDLTHRVFALLKDLEHLAMGSLSKDEMHDLEWMEHQLEQIRTTISLGIVPLYDEEE
jgi:hypothetical protein